MSRLSEAQARRVLSTFGYVDELLREVEHLAREDRSPFERQRSDVAPEEARLLLAQAARLRQEMLSTLDRLGLEPPSHKALARWSIQTALRFARIELEQLDADGLRGYGPVDEEAGDLLGAMTRRMAALAREAAAALRDTAPGGLTERLERLDGREGEILRKVDGAVRRHGLAEVRSLLEAAVESAASTTFDVGLFGRIGAGKSSLVNALLGDEVLPVGARPVTAVPTRVMRGEPGATVILKGGEAKTVSLGELADYVTEEGNPDNGRGVARAEVRHPSVPEGLRLLDTPGVGSLASGAAARTFAWLPRCDLGLLLVAAGGTVERDDLALASGLARAGIELHVLLSKADLLEGGAREREEAVRHVAESLARISGGRAPEVIPVSVRPSGATDFIRFREEVLEPVVAGAHRRRRGALVRRLRHLLRAAEAAIEARGDAGAAPGKAGADAVSEEDLVAADRELRIARGRLRDRTDALSGSADDALDRAARAVSGAWSRGEDGRGAARAAFLDHAGDALEDVRRAAEGIGAERAGDTRTRLPPVFDPPWLDELPGLSPPLGPGLMTLRRARSRLEPVRSSLERSLARYASRLYQWGGSLVEERGTAPEGPGRPPAAASAGPGSASLVAADPKAEAVEESGGGALGDLLERARRLDAATTGAVT